MNIKYLTLLAISSSVMLSADQYGQPCQGGNCPIHGQGQFQGRDTDQEGRRVVRD